MPRFDIPDGLSRGVWRDYTPELWAFNPSGGTTQPIASDLRYRQGRYLHTFEDLVTVRAKIEFLAGDTLGTAGSGGIWAVRLPVPASRAAGADQPIGSAMLWQGAAANPAPLMVGQVSLMDPIIGGGSQGQEDSFIQVFCQSSVAFGTATITSAATSVTVTHGLAFTPNAYDIRVVPTNTSTTNTQWCSVQNIGATTFDIVVKVAPGASTATYSWKIDAFPTTGFDVLMAHNKPWTWAAGHIIGLDLTYEARR